MSSHLRLGLPSGLFSSGFPIKALHAPLLSPTCATCPTHHGMFLNGHNYQLLLSPLFILIPMLAYSIAVVRRCSRRRRRRRCCCCCCERRPIPRPQRAAQYQNHPTLRINSESPRPWETIPDNLRWRLKQQLQQQWWQLPSSSIQYTANRLCSM